MWLFWAGILGVLAFGFVVFFGAPYLPTLRLQASEALDLLDLVPGQTLVELGSGDGRILREAAERGIYAIGYELNPLLVIWSRLANWKYRHYIKVHWRNYWRMPLPITDAIYVFLLHKYMNKLDTKIAQDKQNWGTKKRLRVVSFAFEIPGKSPIKERNGLFLYSY